jgi:hypothetical protein
MKSVIAETMDLPRIESRMLRWMGGLALVTLAAILSTGRWRMGIAFTAGAALGILNFHWLWQTGKVLMASQAARVPSKTVFLMVARYPLVLAGFAILYVSGSLPLVPMIAGLLIPGGGVLVESLFLLGAGLEHKQTA